MTKLQTHNNHIPEIAVLIATRDREQLLLHRSLPSVVRQTIRPEYLVIVNDGKSFSKIIQYEIASLGEFTRCRIMGNNRLDGAAGAWNTGLEYLFRENFDGFVALLDDDDTWDDNHLQMNRQTALENEANIVVSGLRMKKDGEVHPRPFIDSLRDRDFLVGNPGWQGSNTFVSLSIFLAVGCFREGMPSMNDRDIAIRVLRYPRSRTALAKSWTATWYCDTPNNLSAPGSQSKLEGLKMFWRIYGSELDYREEATFFKRTE